MLSKKSIITKTLQIASTTLISRLLGIIREILMVRFLGATDLSDAFLTAFKIPNSLRRIFAEGALSAALIPSVVATLKKGGKKSVSSLITLSFLIFEGMLLLLCILTIIKAETLLRFIAPGFSEWQVQSAVPFLQIMMPFIFFISSSALLATALQGVGHFLIPSLGSIILNSVFIGTITACLHYKLAIEYLCLGIVFAGFIQFLTHFITYKAYDFSLRRFTKEDFTAFSHVFKKFIGSLLSVSIMEISLFIDTSFASYLPKGSISLIYLANRFMNIPLGVFGVAFSTIMLSQFSRIHHEEPEKVDFYLTEAFKLVFVVTVPLSLLMVFFSRDIFYTIFLSEKFTLFQAQEAAQILIAFVVGLFFFAFNKILLNVYYARHDTVIPGIIALIANTINAFLNYLLMIKYKSIGIALATTVSTGMIQTLFLIIGLLRYHGVIFSFSKHWFFITHYLKQLCCITPLFIMLYYGIVYLITHMSCEHLLLKTVGLWAWTAPVIVLYFTTLFATRHYFHVRAYFLGDE